MKIIPFNYDNDDDLFANTYVVIDENLSCIVCDPSKNYDGIVKYIINNKLNLKGILITHSHFDHIGGIKNLLDYKKVDVYIHSYDACGLNDEKINCSYLLNKKVTVDVSPKIIEHNDIINILSEKIIVIHTPYHTKGSVCYYFKESKFLLSGDTLFKRSIGRDDLINADRKSKNQTFTKIMALPDEVVVYPGHGPKTSIIEERKYNQYIN